MDELFDAWRVNNVINLKLLGLCPDEAMDLKPGRGKTIRSNWVHLVGVRRSHLEAMLPREAARVPKLDWKTARREEIEAGLTESYAATVLLLERLAEKPIRWTPAKFFGYSVAHEAHHRSQIEIALRLSGHELPDEAMYELWNWPKL